MKMQTIAQTNLGQANIEVYSGYLGTPCVAFVLSTGCSFSGWSVSTVLNFKHHELCLDGGSDTTCTNMFEVVQGLKVELAGKIDQLIAEVL